MKSVLKLSCNWPWKSSMESFKLCSSNINNWSFTTQFNTKNYWKYIYQWTLFKQWINTTSMLAKTYQETQNSGNNEDKIVINKLRHLRHFTHMVQFVPSLLLLDVIVVFFKTCYSFFWYHDTKHKFDNIYLAFRNSIATCASRASTSNSTG